MPQNIVPPDKLEFTRFIMIVERLPVTSVVLTDKEPQPICSLQTPLN